MLVFLSNCFNCRICEYYVYCVYWFCCLRGRIRYLTWSGPWYRYLSSSQFIFIETFSSVPLYIWNRDILSTWFRIPTVMNMQKLVFVYLEQIGEIFWWSYLFFLWFEAVILKNYARACLRCCQIPTCGSLFAFALGIVIQLMPECNCLCLWLQNKFCLSYIYVQCYHNLK